MSLLVRYSLKSPDSETAQHSAMKVLVAALRVEGVPVEYSGFSTGDPTQFIGILEFADDVGKQAFLASKAFADYRETVTPFLAGPPGTTDIALIASTRK